MSAGTHDEPIETPEAHGTAAGTPDGHAETHGGTWKLYVMIGVVLTVITAAEVAVFYIPILRPVLVPILLVLSVGKFALVVMFFMHLKYDSQIFSGVFVAPLVLAVLVVVGMVILFHFLPLYTPG